MEPEDLDRFLREDADRCVELGFTQFTLGFNGPDWALARGEPWLRLARRSATLRAERSAPGHRRDHVDLGTGRNRRSRRARSPSTKTLRWVRIDGPASSTRFASPGTRGPGP